MTETAENTLLAIAGLLLIINGMLPLLSDKYYQGMRAVWDSASYPTETEQFIYNKFIRNIPQIILGVALLAYLLWW